MVPTGIRAYVKMPGLSHRVGAKSKLDETSTDDVRELFVQLRLFGDYLLPFL